jgi:septal ring factor EnvC (AmiA/AmiB activator)
VSLLHHGHHYVPFDDHVDDPVGDRRQLKVEIGRLRRQVLERDARIAELEQQVGRLESAVGRLESDRVRRWRR